MSSGGLPDYRTLPHLKCLFVKPRVAPVVNMDYWSDEEIEDEKKIKSEEDNWQNFQDKEKKKLDYMTPKDNCDDNDDSKSYISSNLSDIETLSGVTTVVSSLALTDKNQDFSEYEWRPSNRETLPVDLHREQIIDLSLSEKVLVISGHTGCGKTTQVPQFILDRCLKDKKDCNIIVTQPRKIAAKSIAEHVCRERGLQLGGLVGYHVGLDKVNKSEDTKILYVTTGVLKEMLIGNKDIGNKYTHIIMDEVHEREIDTDFILTFLKKQMMTSGTSYKLILMSATINRERFQDYFAMRVGDDKTVRAPHLDVGNDNENETTNKRVTVLRMEKFPYLKNIMKYSLDEPKMNECAIQAAIKVLESLDGMDKKSGRENRAGAVLIFLPGIREMEQLEERLRSALSKRGKTETFKEPRYIQLHSSIAWQDQQLAFQEVAANERKVILATNVAESSITLKDIVYVLDFCLTKRLEKDPSTEYPQLELCWASRQQLQQRKGRAGRVDIGHVFQFIPEDLYNALDEEQKPEITRVPLANVVLEIKMCDFGSPKEFLSLTMDCPKYADLVGAVKKLKLVGALLPTVQGEDSVEDGDLTVMGEVIARLPIDVQLGKLIVLGHIFGILDEAIIIAAGLNGKSIFNTYYKEKLLSFGSKLHWSSGSQSDFVAILNAYNSWHVIIASGECSQSVKLARAKKHCDRYNLAQKQLNEMSDLIQEIRESLKRGHIETMQRQPKSANPIDKGLLLDIVLFGAFYPNYFHTFYNEQREKDAFRLVMENDPMRSVYFTHLPREDYAFAELYTSQVKKFLEPVVGTNAIEDIKFDRTKIIVVLKPDSRSSENSIPAAALKAVKNWNLKNELDLDLYHPEKAKQFLENLKSNTSQSSYHGCLKVDQLPPPSMTTTRLNMQIMSIENPGCMWVVYEENWEALTNMQQIISQNCRDCPMATDIQVGGIYLACDNGIFYRVRVESLNPTQVLFIDYGEIKQCKEEEIRSIPVELQADLSNPAYAVEISLIGVQPYTVKNTINQWSEDLVEKMEEYNDKHILHEKFFTGEIHADMEAQGFNKFKLKLKKLYFTKKDGTRDEWIDWLLRNKHALPVPISYSVQIRAKERLEFALKHDGMQEHLNNPDRYKDSRPTDISIQHHMTTRRVALKGPYHAMQTSIVGSTQVNSGKIARIDPASVNSVLLDWNPAAENNHWMITDTICKSATSGNLILRNTGWLPCRPGIGPLAIMMFAPRVQMRINKERTNFVGFLAGLGYKKEAGENNKWSAIYPEYDAEIDFDIRVGVDELMLLDGIRHTVSEALTYGPEGVLRLGQPNFMHKSREAIMKNLNNLIFKEMAYKVKDETHKAHKLHPGWYGGMHRNNQDRIFSKIESPQLLKIRDLVAALKMKAGVSTELLNPEEYCPVCSQCLTSAAQITEHLESVIHAESLKRVENIY